MNKIVNNRVVSQAGELREKISFLILHCTATPEGRWIEGNDIIRWHTTPAPKGYGWRRPGYTDIILLDGTIERLIGNNEDAFVDSWEITNGVKGLNSIARHVSYVGGTDLNGIPKDTRTPEQIEVMWNYIVDFKNRFPKVRIAGHNEFAAKACPCFDVPKWIQTMCINKLGNLNTSNDFIS